MTWKHEIHEAIWVQIADYINQNRDRLRNFIQEPKKFRSMVYSEVKPNAVKGCNSPKRVAVTLAWLYLGGSEIALQYEEDMKVLRAGGMDKIPLWDFVKQVTGAYPERNDSVFIVPDSRECAPVKLKADRCNDCASDSATECACCTVQHKRHVSSMPNLQQTKKPTSIQPKETIMTKPFETISYVYGHAINGASDEFLIDAIKRINTEINNLAPLASESKFVANQVMELNSAKVRIIEALDARVPAAVPINLGAVDAQVSSK